MVTDRVPTSKPNNAPNNTLLLAWRQNLVKLVLVDGLFWPSFFWLLRHKHCVWSTYLDHIWLICNEAFQNDKDKLQTLKCLIFGLFIETLRIYFSQESWKGFNSLHKHIVKHKMGSQNVDSLEAEIAHCHIYICHSSICFRNVWHRLWCLNGLLKNVWESLLQNWYGILFKRVHWKGKNANQIQ